MNQDCWIIDPKTMIATMPGVESKGCTFIAYSTNQKVLVIKRKGGTYYGGTGQSRPYYPTQYELYKIITSSISKDGKFCTYFVADSTAFLEFK
jgi:hypothetical protein